MRRLLPRTSLRLRSLYFLKSHLFRISFLIPSKADNHAQNQKKHCEYQLQGIAEDKLAGKCGHQFRDLLKPEP